MGPTESLARSLGKIACSNDFAIYGNDIFVGLNHGTLSSAFVISSIPIQQRPGQFCSDMELAGVCASFLRAEGLLMGLRRKNVPAGHTCFAAAAFFAGHFTQAASHAGRVSERMGVSVKMPPADSPGRQTQ